MGQMNEFVDANIATLQVLMQEKRKLLMRIEEQKLNFRTVINETDLQAQQLELSHQEHGIAAMRQ